MPDPVNTHPSFEEWRLSHPPMMGAEEPEAGPEPEVQGDPPEQQPSTDAPPWGEDFDASRAWKTIQDQRQSEQTLKQQLSEANRVQQMWEAAQNDPDLQQQILNHWGYDVEADAEPDTEQVFQDPRVDTLLQERQNEAITRELGEHIRELAETAGVELKPRQFQRIFRDAWDAGLDRTATEQVFNQWIEDRKAEEKDIIDGYVKSKRTSRPAPNGVPGSEKVNLANEEERLKYFAAQLEARSDID